MSGRTHTHNKDGAANLHQAFSLMCDRLELMNKALIKYKHSLTDNEAQTIVLYAHAIEEEWILNPELRSPKDYEWLDDYVYGADDIDDDDLDDYTERFNDA